MGRLRCSAKGSVTLGSYQTFTFEFDVSDRKFLNVQLQWLRTRKKGKLDCSMGDLYLNCATYGDFAGMTVNYSGNKSLHIHIVFRTDLARERLRLDELSPRLLRNGLAAHWERLHEDVLRHLKVPLGIRADEHLRFPESFRRVPNGSRIC